MAEPAGNQDFWELASSPVRYESSEDEDDDAQLEAFQAEGKPEEKTRQQVISEGIDRSPMLSVTEIRARFNKETGPVFPKQVFIATKKSTVLKSSPSAVEEEKPVGQSPEPEGQAAVEEAPPDVEEPQPSEEKMSVIVTPPAEKQREAESQSSTKSGLLSSDEFAKLATLHGCDEALQYFLSPRKIDLLIKPDTKTASLIKQMALQFNKEHRLLVMVRKSAVRYVRLNDVTRVDSRDACVAAVGVTKTSSLGTKKPFALFFSTAPFPMIILLNSDHERELLFKLTIFLRQLLKTNRALEICA